MVNESFTFVNRATKSQEIAVALIGRTESEGDLLELESEQQKSLRSA
jgi:hypothetical protein